MYGWRVFRNCSGTRYLWDLLHSVFVPTVSALYNVSLKCTVFQSNFVVIKVNKWHYITQFRIFITATWACWQRSVSETAWTPSCYRWLRGGIASLSVLGLICFIQLWRYNACLRALLSVPLSFPPGNRRSWFYCSFIWLYLTGVQMVWSPLGTTNSCNK